MGTRQVVEDCVAATASLAVLRWLWTGVSAARGWRHDMMADGLPIYLTAATLRRGGDPTSAEALARTYADQGLDVQAHHFSTLYPASTGALLGPLVPDDWSSFTTGWRVALLVAAAVAGATGAASGVDRRRWFLAASLGAVATTVALPTALACARLGQINQLLGAMAGVAQLGLACGLGGLAMAVLVVGGGLKLAPVLAAVPIAAAARGRAIAVLVGVGLGVLALTAVHVPLDRAAAAVLETLRFQAETAGYAVADLPPRSPVWMKQVVGLRHGALGLLTALLALGAGLRSRAVGPPALVGAVALVFAWVGTEAAAQHELYLPLLLASLAFAITWPLQEGAPRVSWLGAAVVAAAVAWLAEGDTPRAFGAVVLGEAVWAVVAARVVYACVLPRPGLVVAVLLGGLVLYAGGGAALRTGHPPERRAPPTLPEPPTPGPVPVGA